VRDPFLEGMGSGWEVIDASALVADRTLEVDVAIVGSGAGGGIAAEILAKAGLKVAIVEEGPLKTSTDFKLREADAYPQLYQESAARKTKDKAINVLQGRCVGGSHDGELDEQLPHAGWRRWRFWQRAVRPEGASTSRRCRPGSNASSSG
jgi:choline dehydrogenase-like flavoprotein